MMINIPESQVVDIEAVLSRKNSYGNVSSEIEVLRSRMLAAKVIERLGLLNHPEFNPSLRKPEFSETPGSQALGTSQLEKSGEGGPGARNSTCTAASSN